MAESKAKSLSESSFNRACDACRQHKIRCLPSASDSSTKCQRCEKMERACVFTAPHKRKQRKRTDTRVAELEQEVQAMKALFEQPQKRSKLGLDTPSDRLDSTVEDGASCTLVSVLGLETEANTACSNGSSRSGQLDEAKISRSPELDVIDRGILSIEQAEFLFHSYNEDLAYHYPAVIIPPKTTAHILRTTKPTLFLSVITAASGKYSPRLYSLLFSEAVKNYVQRAVIENEKCLELVQSMLIICVWYNPPGSYAMLKCYEYIHMAVTMAIDIGLGTNPGSARTRRIKPEVSLSKLSDQEIENRRTFLACYMGSSAYSFTSKRPNMLRYNNFIDGCLETLESVPDILPSDRIICAWVRLLKITEEVHTSFSYDDLGSVVSLSETRIQSMVKAFGKALSSWRDDVEPLEKKDTLLMAYHHTQILMHELSLHDDHFPENFRPPYISETLFSINVDPNAKCSHIEFTTALIHHIQSLFDTFLTMHPEVLRSVPVYFYVRIMYAVIVLTKVYISSKSPQSKVGVLIDTQSLKYGTYLSEIIEKLREAASPLECRAPLTFLSLIIWVRDWYRGQENDAVFHPPTCLPRPNACTIPPLSLEAQARDTFLGGGFDLDRKGDRAINNTAPMPVQDDSYHQGRYGEPAFPSDPFTNFDFGAFDFSSDINSAWGLPFFSVNSDFTFRGQD